MHVMMDLETMGLTPGCAVLTVGLVLFDPRGEIGAIKDTRIIAIDLLSSVLAGLTIDQTTVRWWRGQSDEARAALLDGPMVTLPEAVRTVERQWAEWQPEVVWANGPASDVVWWEAACAAVGHTAPWSFRQVRCMRTIGAITGLDKESLPEGRVAHSALDDATWQADFVQRCYGRLAAHGMFQVPA